MEKDEEKMEEMQATMAGLVKEKDGQRWVRNRTLQNNYIVVSQPFIFITLPQSLNFPTSVFIFVFVFLRRLNILVQDHCPEMEPEFLCFKKRLSNRDVQGNLEIPKRASFLPDGNGVMLVTDQDGTTYEFIASVRADGRRSLTRDWHIFAMEKLRATKFLRIIWLGNGNEYVVQAGLELHGQRIVWETL